MFADFWGGFYNRSTEIAMPVLIPAYPEDYAKERDERGNIIPPPFPYITYQVARPAYGNASVVMGKVWNQTPGNPGNFSLVDDVLSQATEKIPEEGTILSIGAGGTVVLSRSNPFIQYVPQEDSTIVMGLISIIIKNYVL